MCCVVHIQTGNSVVLHGSLCKYIEMDQDIYVHAAECGFPLAEKRKKRKTFFSHTAGNLGSGLRGVSGHMACKVSVFVLPSAIA